MVLQASVAGVSTPRMLEQWPALANQGIAQTSFVMNGCALRPVHVHMRATGLLYAIQGESKVFSPYDDSMLSRQGKSMSIHVALPRTGPRLAYLKAGEEFSCIVLLSTSDHELGFLYLRVAH